MARAILRRTFRELRRRKVFRAAAIYAVAAWAVVEVTSVVVPALFLPELVVTAVVLLAIAGFPVAMMLAWFFDISLAGFDRTQPLPATSEPASPAAYGPRVSAETPAVATSPTGNLPQPLTSFVGRERELEQATSLLAGCRLLTITGPGGVGKTRLALRLAERSAAGHPDGAWLVELAALTEPALVGQAVATALGVRGEAGRTHAETVARHLETRQALLLLDNCEHVVGACADLVAPLLQRCPGVRVLATSQEALGAPGETRYALAPFELPADTASEANPAVQLFVERARAADPAFRLTRANAPSVAQICRRLDGIPLALELAAARIRVLPAEEIAARLDDRFRLLTGGSRTALPRQQTLRALLDWSYDLLSTGEQTLLARLSVFAGGFTLPATEAVCADAALPGDAVLDALTGLVDRSLVIYDAQQSPTRYRLLETVRQYAAARLIEGGDEGKFRDAHAAYFASLVRRASPELEGPGEAPWLGVLDREHDNLRVALARIVAGGDAATALEVAGPLARFWRVRGYLAEGRRQMAALLPGGGARPPASVAAAKALHGAGWLARDEGDYAAARALFGDALEIARAVDDPLSTAWALIDIAFLERYEGRYDAAGEVLSEARDVAAAAGERVPLAAALGNLGLVARDVGRFDEARALLAESLDVARAVGDRLGIAWALTNLGLIASYADDEAGARALLDEALGIWRDLGDRQNIAYTLSNIGHITTAQGDVDRARVCLHEGLALLREAGDRRGIAFVLERLVALEVARGRYEVALRTAAHAAALRDAIGARQPPSLRDAYERQLERARSAIPPAAQQEAWREGHAAPLEAIVAGLWDEPGEADEDAGDGDVARSGPVAGGRAAGAA